MRSSTASGSSVRGSSASTTRSTPTAQRHRRRRRGLAQRGVRIVAEATYPRGAKFTDDVTPAVTALRRAGVDVVLCTGAYQGCGAFVRTARDAGWTVPISNLSFVGSDAMLALLVKHGKSTGRDYTRALVNSQVVRAMTTSAAGVAEYRLLMDRHNRRAGHAARSELRRAAVQLHQPRGLREREGHGRGAPAHGPQPRGSRSGRRSSRSAASTSESGRRSRSDRSVTGLDSVYFHSRRGRAVDSHRRLGGGNFGVGGFMIPVRLRFGLLPKMVVFLAVVLIPLAAITWYVSVRTLRQEMTEEFTSKGTAIANSLASSGVDLILTRDASTVQASSTSSSPSAASTTSWSMTRRSISSPTRFTRSCRPT